MGNSERQDLLSKLGALRPQESVEGEGREMEESREKFIAQ